MLKDVSTEFLLQVHDSAWFLFFSSQNQAIKFPHAVSQKGLCQVFQKLSRTNTLKAVLKY